MRVCTCLTPAHEDDRRAVAKGIEIRKNEGCVLLYLLGRTAVCVYVCMHACMYVGVYMCMCMYL
jgi:hypothetical protein